jgi:hypothetical protein
VSDRRPVPFWTAAAACPFCNGAGLTSNASAYPDMLICRCVRAEPAPDVEEAEPVKAEKRCGCDNQECRICYPVATLPKRVERGRGGA